VIQAIATFCLPYPAGTLRQRILLARNRPVPVLSPRRRPFAY